MIPTPVLVTFLLVVGIIGSAYYLLVVKPEDDEQRALRKRLKTGVMSKAAAAAGLLRTETPFSQIPVINVVLGATGIISRPSQRLIDRSGLNLTVGALILMCLCAAVAGFLITQTLSGLTLASAVIGAFCAVSPIWFLNFKAKSRLAKFEEQFPEAIDLLARARAGHAFTTGLSMVAEEMADPVGTEFRLAYDRQNFGMPMPDALKALGERVPLLDARFFVTAVLTQRESGGNLSEVLDNLASVIRERFKVKRQVRVVTAHARITGWVLAMLPPGLGIVLTLLAPTHMSLLWTHPTGIRMVIVALILQVTGTLIIRKMVDVGTDAMDQQLLLSLALTFVGVAVLSGLIASVVLARSSPERRRLREMAAASGLGSMGIGAPSLALTDKPDAMARRVATFVPKSPKEMGRLARRLSRAGYRNPRAAAYFAAAEVLLPIALALLTVTFFGLYRGTIFALLAAGVGYALPGFWLALKTSKRQKEIQNGLPDALDLLIVCVEAGAGLDAAIVKASEELAISYPALAEELTLITTETRAGKPRLEAFRNFAARTGVDDVRQLVAMLVQTDKFGTSIAQALRTHAATARTKRRQRAEERAAKLGVKLVFPLVFCLFPALYVVVLGPAIIKIMENLIGPK